MHRSVESRRVRRLMGECGKGLEALEQRCMFAAPVLMTTGGISEYTEDGIPLPIDQGVTVVDADSMIVSAAVRITGGFAPGEDALVFEDQMGITGSWNAASGVLSLSGVASPAAYQAALRTVAYWNSSNYPSDALRTVSFSASDGAQSSSPRTKLLLVTPDNDAPVIAMSGGSASFVEDAGPAVIDAGLRISDVDSDTIWGALVQITGNYAAGEDSLVFADQLGISGSWDAESGTLLLVGFGTLSEYEAALRSVQYANSSQQPSSLVRTVSFEVSDGALPSVPGLRDVVVQALNEAPVLAGSSAGVSYIEDASPSVLDSGFTIGDDDSAMIVSATIVISGNYQAGQDALVFVDQGGISGSWDGATGTLTLTGAAPLAVYEAALRSVAYVNSSQHPSAQPRVITVSVSDGVDSSNAVSQSVSVVPMNDAPSAASSTGRSTYTQGGAAATVDAGVVVGDVDSPQLAGAVIRISSNFAPGDELVFSAQSGIAGAWDAASGTLTLSGAASVAAYQAALRSVQFRMVSGASSTALRTVTMTVTDTSGAASASAARDIEVLAGQNPPPPPPPPACHRPPCHARPPACHISLPPQARCGVRIIMAHLHAVCERMEDRREERRDDRRHGHDRDRCDDRHGRQENSSRDHGRRASEPACPPREGGRGAPHGRGR